MVLSTQEESLISLVRSLPPEEADKVLHWAHQLADVAQGRRIEWSDSWSDDILPRRRRTQCGASKSRAGRGLKPGDVASFGGSLCRKGRSRR